MHKAPFMGTVPWAKVMTALKEAGYEGEFNFELQPEKVPDPASMELYEQYSVEIGKYLIDLFEKA
jgi:sugar phosphate isomerase/epimerase